VTDADLVLGFLDPGFFLGGQSGARRRGSRRPRSPRAGWPKPLGMGHRRGKPRASTRSPLRTCREPHPEEREDRRGRLRNAADFVAGYAVRRRRSLFTLTRSPGVSGLSEIVVAARWDGLGLQRVRRSRLRRHPRVRADDSDYRAVRLPSPREGLRGPRGGWTGALEREGRLRRRLGPAPALPRTLKYTGQLYGGRDLSARRPHRTGRRGGSPTAFRRSTTSVYGAGAGYREVGLEIVNFRVRALGKTKQVPPEASSNGGGPPNVHGKRNVFWPYERETLETAIYRPAGAAEIDIKGPAIIELADTSVSDPPGSHVTSRPDRSLILRFEEAVDMSATIEPVSPGKSREHTLDLYEIQNSEQPSTRSPTRSSGIACGRSTPSRRRRS